MPELAAWDSFYVIVGSAAGALIGLQFVVLTLVAERPPARAADAGAAFASPTLVYFGTVLLLSALARVPWPMITVAAPVWALVGLIGIAYTAIVAGRIRRQSVYRPGSPNQPGAQIMSAGILRLTALLRASTGGFTTIIGHPS